MTFAGFEASFYYRQLTPGAEQPPTSLLGRQGAPKMPCNHQISFAGIHHTCQNNCHKTDFFSSLFLAISVVSWKYVPLINHTKVSFWVFFKLGGVFLWEMMPEMLPCQY